MPLEYLPTTDVKKTVEKKVKPKRSTEELTTVESPGRPVPASNLEKTIKKKIKKRKLRKKAKASEKQVTISKAKKDSILIITEKPQSANKIANALGTPSKYSENKVPYYEVLRDGNKIIVCSAVGHLFNLTYSKGQTGYPIFKTEWVPSYTKKNAAFTKNYYNLLKKLVRRAKEIIIATDYDIEGEIIGWNVLRFIARTENAKRMKYSTLTKNELIESYENPLPTLDWGQAYAGETRHLTDWLYGINLSRALMSAIKRTGSFRILSIGRVQGPTLKIIVERDKEISSFISKPYWQILAHSNNIIFKHPKDIFDKPALDNFKNIKEAVAKTAKKEEIIPPPTPFDLTTLQRESFAKYRISPSNTLRIAQSLYLDGTISYPRTSSQKIPDQINPKEILKKLSQKFPDEIKLATRTSPIEGKKTDPAHPSIYPTGEFKAFSEDEDRIYNLIAKRFISCFSPDAKTANKKITLAADNGKTFTASGLTVLEKGWSAIYPTKFEEKSLPDMEGPVSINKMEFPQKETQPPKRYTPTSLISLLEKRNLGTKSTRSMIVDTLFNRGYLDGKSIKATPLGMKLIEALEKYSPIIISEVLTRNVEEKMDGVRSTQRDLVASKSRGSEELRSKIESDFINELQKKEESIIQNTERIIKDISKDFKAHEIEIGKDLLEGTEKLREIERENSNLMPCPICNKGQLTIKYSRKTKRSFVGCTNYPECTATYSLPPNSLIKKTEKVSEDGLPILMAIRKGKRPWEFAFDPHWREKQRKNTSPKK